MSNPIQVGASNNMPAIVEATATEQSFDTDSDKQYILTHNTINESGTGATGAIAVAFNDATASIVSGMSKALLVSGTPLVVGPEIKKISFIASAGVPTFTVSPVVINK